MKIFEKRNESFTCLVCGVFVPPHPSSSRDHCNSCLFSRHVDIHPGDRANMCHGILQPIGIRNKSSGLQIAYRCQQCGEHCYNIVAPDDDYDLIVELSTRPLTIKSL